MRHQCLNYPSESVRDWYATETLLPWELSHTQTKILNRLQNLSLPLSLICQRAIKQVNYGVENMRIMIGYKMMVALRLWVFDSLCCLFVFCFFLCLLNPRALPRKNWSCLQAVYWLARGDGRFSGWSLWKETSQSSLSELFQMSILMHLWFTPVGINAIWKTVVTLSSKM